MKSLEIISLLEVYKNKIVEVIGADEEFSIASAYSFVMIETSKLHIQFEVNDSSAKLSQLYPEDVSIKNRIESEAWPGFVSKIETSKLPDEIIRQLETADLIASKAVNCTSGDHYRPGNFSKIICRDNEIELQQINHMNSRSIDHKKDYSLRWLIFKIYLKERREMEIDFRDSSSPNKKHCGDSIREAINLAYPSQASL